MFRDRDSRLQVVPTDDADWTQEDLKASEPAPSDEAALGRPAPEPTAPAPAPEPAARAPTPAAHTTPVAARKPRVSGRRHLAAFVLLAAVFGGAGW
jgi:hypothetical protein